MTSKQLNNYPIEIVKIETQQQTAVDPTLTLSDNLIIMLVKQIEYVETLTKFRNGFLFPYSKTSVIEFEEELQNKLVPCQYQALWAFIEQSQLSRCRAIKIFLNKMLASKSSKLAPEFVNLYFECLEHILHVRNRFGTVEFTEKQLIEFSRVFSKNFCKRIIIENQYGEFLQINFNYLGIGLLDRNVETKQIKAFQDCFHQMYTAWKAEFRHLVEVAYYCLCVQFYQLPVNYLYEGYFRNTEFQTERGVPKYTNIKS